MLEYKDITAGTTTSNQALTPLSILSKFEGIKKKIISNKILSIFFGIILISLIFIFHNEISAILEYLSQDKNIKILKFLMFVWLISWNVYYFSVICIYSLKIVNKFKYPNYLPKIILNWLENMDEKIKLQIHGELITTYIKTLLFFSKIFIW